MSISARDEQVLQHIIMYCTQVEKTIESLGITPDSFRDNFIFRNAVSMPLLQIGELAKKLTEEFRAKYDGMPWRSIAGMRDRFAHDYGKMNVEAIWETASNEIPVLHKYCESVIKQKA